MSPGPPDPPGPHGPGQAGALPNQGYHEIIPVTGFNMFLIFFSVEQLKFEVQKSFPHLHQI